MLSHFPTILNAFHPLSSPYNCSQKVTTVNDQRDDKALDVNREKMSHVNVFCHFLTICASSPHLGRWTWLLWDSTSPKETSPSWRRCSRSSWASWTSRWVSEVVVRGTEGSAVVWFYRLHLTVLARNVLRGFRSFKAVVLLSPWDSHFRAVNNLGCNFM